MIGLLSIIAITPVLVSFNSQGLLDSILKDIQPVVEKTIGKVEITASESITTYSDNNYQTKTTTFSVGQTMYLQVKTYVDGTTKKVLDLLDGNKNKINSYELNKMSNNPFIYTQSFPAPDTNGMYYLNIEIRNGENNVYNAQQNITVSKINGNVKAESTAVATANQVSPIATPQMMPKIAGESGKGNISFAQKMNQVFMYVNNILSNLQKLLSTVNSK